MIRTLTYQILKINKAAGIEVCLLEEGGFAINVILASVHKNKIRHSTMPAIADLDKLPGILKTDTPVYVSITGKGTLNKIFKGADSDDITIERILPNINHKDFYFNVWKDQETKVASLGKKDAVDNVVNVIISMGYKVLGFSTGICTILQIAKYITPESGDTICTTNATITFGADQKIESVDNMTVKSSHPDTEYLVGDQYLQSRELIAYGAAIALIGDDLKNTPFLSSAAITDTRKEYRNEKFFKSALWVSLAFIVGILLSNFFFYNHYFSLNQEIEAKQHLNASEHIRLDSLQKQVNESKTFLVNAGWSKPPISSYIADRIAEMVPNTITLTAMNINPANNELSAFKMDTILVAGTCDDAMEVNRFMNNIKSLRHIGDASITGYQYKRDLETGIFQMEIITK